MESNHIFTTSHVNEYFIRLSVTRRSAVCTSVSQRSSIPVACRMMKTARHSVECLTNIASHSIECPIFQSFYRMPRHSIEWPVLRIARNTYISRINGSIRWLNNAAEIDVVSPCLQLCHFLTKAGGSPVSITLFTFNFSRIRIACAIKAHVFISNDVYFELESVMKMSGCNENGLWYTRKS